MTREELRDKMLISGDLERPDKSNSNWALAFELYREQTKDYEVSMACGSCYNKVKQWLMK